MNGVNVIQACSYLNFLRFALTTTRINGKIEHPFTISLRFTCNQWDWEIIVIAYQVIDGLILPKKA